ncbi:hypothetical protein KY285_029241 [Solanum tuberosum]|nr:hypothetical protein KY289_029378 [Solanum tuberosum]KAH0668035.1 hypothetical protein KY285_029241 [Solanum tuberosum]
MSDIVVHLIGSTKLPVTKFNTFMVEDRPGEQWVTLRRKFGEDEHIKIEATMIDGAITVPKANDENLAEDVRLHLSVLVDIWKGEGSEFLEFVCSSWPNSLEIQKVYLLRSDSSRALPYMGPNVKDLNSGFRDGLNEFLKARGKSGSKLNGIRLTNKSCGGVVSTPSSLTKRSRVRASLGTESPLLGRALPLNGTSRCESVEVGMAMWRGRAGQA